MNTGTDQESIVTKGNKIRLLGKVGKESLDVYRKQALPMIIL